MAVGDLAGPERARQADHVVVCRRCSENLQILIRTHEQTLGRPGGARSLRPWIAAAAIALVFVALAAVWTARSSGTRDAFRGARAGAAESVVPADGAKLGEPPTVLRWPAQPESEGYRVRLFTSAGDGLWEANAGSVQQLTVPESLRSRLLRGQSYFWTVEVRMPVETQRLGPFTFTLRP